MAAAMTTAFPQGEDESLRIEGTRASPVSVEGTGIVSEPQPKKRRLQLGNIDPPAIPAVAKTTPAQTPSQAATPTPAHAPPTTTTATQVLTGSPAVAESTPAPSPTTAPTPTPVVTPTTTHGASTTPTLTPALTHQHQLQAQPQPQQELRPVDLTAVAPPPAAPVVGSPSLDWIAPPPRAALNVLPHGRHSGSTQLVPPVAR